MVGDQRLYLVRFDIEGWSRDFTRLVEAPDREAAVFEMRNHLLNKGYLKTGAIFTFEIQALEVAEPDMRIWHCQKSYSGGPVELDQDYSIRPYQIKEVVSVNGHH